MRERYEYEEDLPLCFIIELENEILHVGGMPSKLVALRAKESTLQQLTDRRPRGLTRLWRLT